MLRRDDSESTALCVRSAQLETGVIEACGMLADGAPAALVVVADDPLSSEYPVTARRAPFPYALAMVLVPGDDWNLSWTREEGPMEQLSEGQGGCVPGQKGGRPSEVPYWGALDWIAHCLQGRRAFSIPGSRQRWHWQRQT